jgi:hypothetical protein
MAWYVGWKIKIKKGGVLCYMYLIGDLFNIYSLSENSLIGAIPLFFLA